MKKIAVLHYGRNGRIEIYEMLDTYFEEIQQYMEDLAPMSDEDWEYIYELVKEKGRKIETIYPDFSMSFVEEE